MPDPALDPTSSSTRASSSEGEGLETSLESTWSGPPWVTAVALLATLAWVAWCYRRERGASGTTTRWFLTGLRGALFGVLAWMIYGWVEQRHRTDLPDVVVLIDDSLSMATIDTALEKMVASKESAWFEKLRREASEPTRIDVLRALVAESIAESRLDIEARYHLKWYRMGDSLRPWAPTAAIGELPWHELAAVGSASRLGQAVMDALQLQRGRPTAAIVLFTDGVTTEGPTLAEAARQARRRQTPLYLVGVGSEQAPSDVRLIEVRSDEVAFVDDALHFDAQLSAQGYSGRTARVRLRREESDETLAESRVKLEGDGALQTVRLTHRPPREGKWSYVIEVEPLPGEASLANNRLRREILVSEQTVRVLFAQGAPSYEYRFLRSMLGRLRRKGDESRKPVVELRALLQEADWDAAAQDEQMLRVFPVMREELFQFDVVILGDANPALLGANALRNLADFVESRGGGLVLLSGPRFLPRAFAGTPLDELTPFDAGSLEAPPETESLVDAAALRPTELGAAAAPLQLADTPDDSSRRWAQSPGMYWFAAARDWKPGVRVLVEHSERTMPDGRRWPVVVLQFVGAGKVLTHMTDEFWRWSRDPEWESAYERYWLQWLRYLSRSKLTGNRGVQLSSDREEYERGETIRVRARFLDERESPAQDDGVTLVVEREGEERRTVPLTRDPTDRGLFEGTLRQLGEGSYRLGMLSPALDSPPAPARFLVVAPPGEQAKLEMDSAEMKLAARRSEGRFFGLADGATVWRDLPPGRQVRIDSAPPSPLWNRWPMAALFVILIVSEWVWRKRAGML